MRAIVLLSGGLDSTLNLAIALSQGRECLALSFDYGQRHKIELESAKLIAQHYQVPHKIIAIDRASFGKSSLVHDGDVPKNRNLDEIKSGTPNTYVPARNTLFLSYAMAQAEIWDAQEIYIGSNALDNTYPDCRPDFIRAFQNLMNVATQQALEGKAPKLVAPLLKWDKKEIVKQAIALDVPIDLTFSCYSPTKEELPCGECDACTLRKLGLS